MSTTAPPPRRPAADRIALCRAILDGADLNELVMLDVTGFDTGRAAA